MAKETTTNCMEILKIDGENARLDKLAEIYQIKLNEIAEEKAANLSRRSGMIQAGFCCPTVVDKKDPASGLIIGREYKHTPNCRHKAGVK